MFGEVLISEASFNCELISGYNSLNIIEKGICYSTSNDPNIYSNKVLSNNNYENISLSIHNLNPNTHYFFRAYIKSNYGTEYSNSYSAYTKPAPSPILFNPSISYGSVQDNENNTYKTVTIGAQTWMAENLKVSHFNNGDDINTSVGSFSAAQICYKNEPMYKDVFGLLYNGYVIIDSRGVCPTNWHIPKKNEWDILLTNSIVDLNETGSDHWSNPNSNTNLSGFTALPAGYSLGSFIQLNDTGDWWGNTSNDNNSTIFNILISKTNRSNYYDSKENMFSIRCIKD